MASHQSPQLERARVIGAELLEEMRVGDRRVRQLLSVSHHRKVERRLRRRRAADRS